MGSSISTRLIVLLTLALAFIMGGGMLLDYRFSREEILKRLGEEASVEVQVAIQDLENWLNGVQATTLLLGRILEQREYSEQGLRQMLRDVVAHNDEIFGASIALNPLLSDKPAGFAPYYYTENGGVGFADLANSRANYQQQAWFTQPISEGKPLWSEPYFDAGGGEVYMTTYSVPVYRQDEDGGKFLYAVVTADVTLEDLQQVVGQLHLGESSYSLLFSREGLAMSTRTNTQVMKHYSEMNYQGVNLDSWRDLFARALRGENTSADFPCPELEGRCTIRMGRLDSTLWPIAIVYNQQEILAPLHRYEVKTAVVGVGTLGLMVLTIYLLTSRLTRPLQQLSAATEHMARGDMDVPLPRASGQDEVSRLVRSFSSMSRDLKAYIRDLETATANRSRLEGELDAAREIQMSMLPGSGEARWQEAGVELWARVLPAKTVGGDLYTYFREGDMLFIAVGDVSDKGVPAALFMARAISLIQQLSTANIGTGRAMAELNNALERDNHACMFVTLFLGRLDMSSGELCFASAGHTAPSLLNRGQVRVIAQDTGPALGLAADQHYPANTLQLSPGDRLVVFTDGIDEAFSAEAEMYGVERLHENLLKFSSQPLTECGQQVIASVERHAGEQPQSDDITLLLLDYQGRGRHDSTQSFALGAGLSGRISTWLQPLLQGWMLAPELVTEFILVAEELATNVDKYAGLETGQELQIRCALETGLLWIEIRDPGVAFDPLHEGHRSTLGADIESAEIGGLGVHLVTQLTDRQSYRREGGINILRVEKDLPDQD